MKTIRMEWMARESRLICARRVRSVANVGVLAMKMFPRKGQLKGLAFEIPKRAWPRKGVGRLLLRARFNPSKIDINPTRVLTR